MRLSGSVSGTTAEQVEEHGQEQPAFRRAQVSDVAHPALVELLRAEVALEQVGCNWQLMLAVSGLDETPPPPGDDSFLLHQSDNSLPAAALENRLNEPVSLKLEDQSEIRARIGCWAGAKLLQRRLSVSIWLVRIGSALEKEMGGVRVLPEHRGMERRVPGPRAARFNDASASQKKLDRFDRANGRGEPKGRSTVLVLFARARLLFRNGKCCLERVPVTDVPSTVKPCHYVACFRHGAITGPARTLRTTALCRRPSR